MEIATRGGCCSVSRKSYGSFAIKFCGIAPARKSPNKSIYGGAKTIFY